MLFVDPIALLIPSFVGLLFCFLPLDQKKLAKFWLPLCFGVFFLALSFFLYQRWELVNSIDITGIGEYALILFSCLLSFSGLCLLSLFWRWKVNKKICWIDRMLLAVFFFSSCFLFMSFFFKVARAIIK